MACGGQDSVGDFVNWTSEWNEMAVWQQQTIQDFEKTYQITINVYDSRLV